MDTTAELRSDPVDQQVMTAQSSLATPQPPAGYLEGETIGPNYGSAGQHVERAEAPQLPNGILHREPGGSPSAEIESLPYSPLVTGTGSVAVLRQSPSTSAACGAFYGEAWPAQPESISSMRGSPLAWMARLGEFFRTHPIDPISQKSRKS